MNTNDVDAALQALGNRIFNSGPVRKRIRKGMTGLRLLVARSTSTGTRPMNPSEVRRKLRTLAKRLPQVMVRISGGGKGIRHIKAHLDYISRNGQISLEDQTGDRFSGKEDLAALRDEWQFGGFAIAEGAMSRQAFNIVLSMPAGTSEMGVLRAARDFAASEFSNHQYAMALHTLNTDPDDDPSPNPHAHLCVKATGLDGHRLNPRKADLHRWREAFAHHLREHGVECDASRRIERLQSKRGEKQSVRYKKARGERLDRIGDWGADIRRAEMARQWESDMLTDYRKMAGALARSEHEEDRALALNLAKRFAGTQEKPGRAPDRLRDR